jgi:hypothetical protein
VVPVCHANTVQTPDRRLEASARALCASQGNNARGVLSPDRGDHRDLSANHNAMIDLLVLVQSVKSEGGLR